MNIDKTVVERLDKYLGRGLCTGIGSAFGRMCVEAAISLATGEPFDDQPTCVSHAVRRFSISLNDAPQWKSEGSRAAGLRSLAIAQLGSNNIDESEFARRIAEIIEREIVAPLGADVPEGVVVGDFSGELDVDLEYSYNNARRHMKWAKQYAGTEPEISSGETAKAAAYAASYGGEKYLRHAADVAVRVLRELGSPGCEFLEAI